MLDRVSDLRAIQKVSATFLTSLRLFLACLREPNTAEVGLRMIVMAEGIATGEILDATDVAATDMAATLTQGVIMEDRTTAPTVAAMVAMVAMVTMVAMVAEDRCSVADTEAEDTEAHTVEPMVADTATAMDAMDAAAARTEGMVDEWSAADTEAATDMATEEEGAVDTAMDWPLTAVAAARDQVS